MNSSANHNSDDRLRARLALTEASDIVNWQKKESYLEKRKLEAAKAMMAEEQKKLQEEKDRAQQQKIEAQKKLAELENKRRAEEELKKRDISTIQQEKDLAQEKLRQERIRKIIESQNEIEGIKRNNQPRLSAARTLTDDLGEAIKERGLTASRLAQTNTADKGPDETEKGVSWKKITVLTMSLLLILSGMTVIAWSLGLKIEINKAPIEITRSSLIFADEHLAFDLQNKEPEQIKQELNNLYLSIEAAELFREKIKDIYFTYEETKNSGTGFLTEKKIANPTIFTQKTGLEITDDLLRFLQEDFMLGFYLGAEVKPFYVFQSSFYKNSADALLHNENIIVSQFLSPFLEDETVRTILLTAFRDKMIRNRDVRLVINENNETLAIYAWLDKNTFIITIDEFTLEKIFDSFLARRSTR